MRKTVLKAKREEGVESYFKTNNQQSTLSLNQPHMVKSVPSLELLIHSSSEVASDEGASEVPYEQFKASYDTNAVNR
ncbi:hypothetical protein ACHAWX_001327 [Stephanocyclus meneghinianus]